jgi:nitrogen fixation NifU-like protein
MMDLRELYQEVILDHSKHPRNFGPAAGANRHAKGHNPLCGDRIRLRVRLDDDRLADVRFEGSGCAISTASASMMTEAVRGRSVAEALEMAERFRDVMTKPSNEPWPETWGELAALEGVRAFPMRVKCATLAWHALRSALAENAGRVSTE